MVEKMRLSDIVAEKILELLKSAEGNVAEIQRNDLAEKLGCVPSQINYVLTSRFTPEQGYIVESRRGGGGYIRITRVSVDRISALMHLVNSIGPEISAGSARAILQSSVYRFIISEQAALLIESALSDNCHRDIPPILRGKLRAATLKQMFLTLIYKGDTVN